ncbi:MAG: Uma2 family endonuclease [Spirulina sp. DLM2.Bin59]|nr:MAG: Uma2 family endonuclease [Spirulina sp. DLM2.Bin59]
MKILTHWSVEDYHRMIAAGILADRAVELWAGEIVEMSPETPIHYNTAKRGARYLEQLLAGRAEVRFNGPITLADSEPEPDVAIVRLPESAYNTRHPGAEDIFWVIEVAKTSLQQDLEIKAQIYARAGIREYWIVDLTHHTLIVLRDPQGDRYQCHTEHQEGAIAPLAFPDITIALGQLLPV